MITFISLINNVAVSIFGSILSASFCNALDTRKKKIEFIFLMMLIPIVQGMIYSVSEPAFLKKIYPLIVHLPLYLLLINYTGQKIWTLISILTAYLCCQLRRWVALFLVMLLHSGESVQDIVEIILTVPMMILIIKYSSPAIKSLSGNSTKLQLVLGFIPGMYYIFDYGTVVYTDFLNSGTPVAVEFMPFAICIAYLVFLVYFVSEKEKQDNLIKIQNSMSIQMNQAVREINALRESQETAARYRHDLRHHLMYISGCIDNGKTDNAKEYIAEIYRKIEYQKLERFCMNEAVNLIISAFVQRALKSGFKVRVRLNLSENLSVSESDLCVLLSNALENAINSCQAASDEGYNGPWIEIEGYEKNKKLYFQILNICTACVRFDKGVPLSEKYGHGIGVRSICAIVEKHNGMYSFSQNNNVFALRVSI